MLQDADACLTLYFHTLPILTLQLPLQLRPRLSIPKATPLKLSFGPKTSSSPSTASTACTSSNCSNGSSGSAANGYSTAVGGSRSPVICWGLALQLLVAAAWAGLVAALAPRAVVHAISSILSIHKRLRLMPPRTRTQTESSTAISDCHQADASDQVACAGNGDTSDPQALAAPSLEALHSSEREAAARFVQLLQQAASQSLPPATASAAGTSSAGGWPHQYTPYTPSCRVVPVGIKVTH